jgi:ABC-2 type transport system permease protein
MLARSHEDMATFNSFFIVPMSFLSGTFFSPDRLPEPFRSAVLVYPLTHASLLLRGLGTSGRASIASLAVLAAYACAFFILAGLMVRKKS